MKLIAGRDQGWTAFPVHALDVDPAVETADFRHNAIPSFPDDLQRLAQLKTLDAMHNRLTVKGLGLGRSPLTHLSLTVRFSKDSFNCGSSNRFIWIITFSMAYLKKSAI